MRRFLKNLFGANKAKAARGRKRTTVRLTVEGLEERSLMSVSPLPTLAAVRHPVVSAATTNAATFPSGAGTSGNWAGYQITGATGVTAVGGEWVQPAVSGTGSSVSSMWVGIDGAGNNTVEQIGTEADVVDGTPQYSAWYELFGDQSSTGEQGPDYYSVTIPNFTVRPGDLIDAEVSLVDGTTNSFLF